MTDQAPDGKLHKLNQNIPMPTFRFVLPTLVRDEVNQGLRFFDVWDLVPDWAEDKIGQHIYYAFSDDVPVFPTPEPGVPDKVSPDTVAQAWSAIMYVGVLGDRHALAQARREWQLELNKREDVPSWYKKTEAEIMEQYEKDLWYVPPRLDDIPRSVEPDLSNQPKPGEVPPEDENSSSGTEQQPPAHVPSNEELEAETKKAQEAEGDKEPKPEDSSEPQEGESPKEPEAHDEDPQPSPSESEETSSESTPETESEVENEEADSGEELPTPPRPKAALATWRKFAEKIGVEVDKSLSRDEIVEYIKSVRPELFKESE